PRDSPPPRNRAAARWSGPATSGPRAPRAPGPAPGRPGPGPRAAGGTGNVSAWAGLDGNRAIVGKMRMDRIWLGRPPAIMAGHAPPDARRVTEPLLLHVDGAVARLRMNRPALHNAFDAGLVAALTDALARLAADAAVRVVV